MERVHVGLAPPVIVPSDALLASNTVIPIASEGLPVVVKIKPLYDPVKATAAAADQFVVEVVLHVPEPPTQYRAAIYQTPVVVLGTVSSTTAEPDASVI